MDQSGKSDLEKLFMFYADKKVSDGNNVLNYMNSKGWLPAKEDAKSSLTKYGVTDINLDNIEFPESAPSSYGGRRTRYRSIKSSRNKKSRRNRHAKK